MFDWDKDAEKAAKLVTGSKKLILVAMYCLILYKAGPHVAHWVSVKVHAVLTMVA